VSSADAREPLRVAVLASGQGSIFASLVAAGRRYGSVFEVVLLISSRLQAPALAAAGQLGINAAPIVEGDNGPEGTDSETERLLSAAKVDLVVLAGYVRRVGPRTLAAFAGRIINTHPAPLPRFGGKGMYGEHLHRAVLESGISSSAATIHLVDADYDNGSVIAQQAVPVLKGDDVESLKARVQVAEKDLLVTTIKDWAASARSSSGS
jgi:phosphoribosylglycinamide formyltransferase 1